MRTYSRGILTTRVPHDAGAIRHDESNLQQVFYNSRGQLGEIREGRTPNNDSLSWARLSFLRGLLGHVLRWEHAVQQRQYERKSTGLKNSQDQVVRYPTPEL